MGFTVSIAMVDAGFRHLSPHGPGDGVTARVRV
jgi:hypothetical protein